MPEIFESLMYTARHELVITTPNAYGLVNVVASITRRARSAASSARAASNSKAAGCSL